MDKNVFRQLSYGVYVVSSKAFGRINAQVVNALIQVCADPPKVAFAINKQNLTHEYIKESGMASISILSTDAPISLIGQFGFRSGRDNDKFAGIEYTLCDNGCPVLARHVTGFLEVTVVGELDAGTHTLFLADVTGGRSFDSGEPMTYAYYHEVKKGTTPQKAPTYVELPKYSSKTYRCTVCDYVYDPEKGDPAGSIPPGTPFEKLPDSWVCPVCGASKDLFE